MPGARRVPSQYATPALAIEAANAGDVVLLAPGTYDRIMIDKPVHIVGDTTTPAAVRIVNPVDRSGGALIYALDEPWDGQALMVEGVTLEMAASLANGIACNDPLGVTLWVNRCVWDTASASRGLMMGRDAAPWSVRVTHCTIGELQDVSGSTDGMWIYRSPYSSSSTGLEMRLSGCEFEGRAPGVTPGSVLDFDVWAVDYVQTPTAGYGVEYGEWLLPQLLADSYSFGNTLLLADGQHDRAQILLHRVLDDGDPASPARLERYAWMTTRPDPVTGYWEFRYLPTTRSDGSPQRYAYTIWTPVGYAPQTHGRYLPAPET